MKVPNISAFLLLVAATAVGCSGSDDASPDTARATSPSTTASTSTTPETVVDTTSAAPPTTDELVSDPTTTSASTTTAAPPSIPVASDVDWLRVVEDLAQRRQDLYASPDVDRITDVCGENSPCAEQLTVQIADLADKGWRVDGADPVVVGDARVEQFDGDTLDDSVLVTVVAIIERATDAGTIVDATGAEVAAVEPATEEGFNAQGRFILARVGPEGDPWRLISQDTLPEVPV